MSSKRLGVNPMDHARDSRLSALWPLTCLVMPLWVMTRKLGTIGVKLLFPGVPVGLFLTVALPENVFGQTPTALTWHYCELVAGLAGVHAVAFFYRLFRGDEVHAWNVGKIAFDLQPGLCPSATAVHLDAMCAFLLAMVAIQLGDHVLFWWFVANIPLVILVNQCVARRAGTHTPYLTAFYDYVYYRDLFEQGAG